MYLLPEYFLNHGLISYFNSHLGKLVLGRRDYFPFGQYKKCHIRLSGSESPWIVNDGQALSREITALIVSGKVGKGTALTCVLLYGLHAISTILRNYLGCQSRRDGEGRQKVGRQCHLQAATGPTCRQDSQGHIPTLII